MKVILYFSIVFLSFGSFAQMKTQQPNYYWVSKMKLEELQELSVGTKILFQQNCTDKLPKDVSTGIVFFENVFYQQEQFSMSIEFKETVVFAVTYYLNSNQFDLLPILGYMDVKANGSSNNGPWTYIANESNIHTVIVGHRKKIVAVQTKDKSLAIK